MVESLSLFHLKQ